MKKLVIIVVLAIILFITPRQDMDQPIRVAVGTPQNAAMEQTEKVPGTNTEQVEKTTEPTCEPMQTESKVATKEEPTVQTPTKTCNDGSEAQKAAEPEETVKCVDEGDQSLAEYKPQTGWQPNPFEDDTPTEIDDNPVEDYIGEGEDRPGEGKQF